MTLINSSDHQVDLDGTGPLACSHGNLDGAYNKVSDYGKPRNAWRMGTANTEWTVKVHNRRRRNMVTKNTTPSNITSMYTQTTNKVPDSKNPHGRQAHCCTGGSRPNCIITAGLQSEHRVQGIFFFFWGLAAEKQGHSGTEVPEGRVYISLFLPYPLSEVRDVPSPSLFTLRFSDSTTVVIALCRC